MALSEALKRTVSQTSARLSRSGDRMKPKEGRNVYRIVDPTSLKPSWIGADGAFWKEVGTHWIKLEPNGKPVAVVGAPDICYDEPNPIAAAVDVAIQAQVDEDSKKFFEDMRARHTIWINAIERTSKADNQEVGVLELTKTAFGEILNLMQIYDDQGMDLFDPVNGVDIIITRIGKGLDTKYSVQVQPGKSVPISSEALSKANDLAALVAKELFKGEETKALNAISTASGIPLPRLNGNTSANLTLAARTPTPALTSPALAVPDAAIPATAVAATPVVPAQPVAAPATPVEDPAIAALRAQLAAAEAAAKVTAVAAAPVTADPAPVAETTSEEDAILKELEGL